MVSKKRKRGRSNKRPKTWKNWNRRRRRLNRRLLRRRKGIDRN
jgi:hypothetical protein